MPCGLGGNKTTQRKLVLLGDGACGKTSLLNVFTRGYFPTVYEPTVFENYVHDIFVDNVHIELSLWDTAGQEEFDRLRSLSYDDTHAIMLCFSVDSKDSLENVESKWVGEIAENCQGVKLVLVALKCDLREQAGDDEASAAEGSQPREKKDMIDYNQGLEVARRINALRYLECSAMRNRGVNEAFTEAARVALSVKGAGSKDNSTCDVILFPLSRRTDSHVVDHRPSPFTRRTLEFLKRQNKPNYTPSLLSPSAAFPPFSRPVDSRQALIAMLTRKVSPLHIYVEHPRENGSGASGYNALFNYLAADFVAASRGDLGVSWARQTR
ncbi:hypothetical protein LZ554_005481 [Drepanopeziza brunnea f. sp. 'monogermtubi']|nr:hypothetical protein LZ554_005481 [Drepanopeziza brunnea f. sp. 'monogermtubi']